MKINYVLGIALAAIIQTICPSVFASVKLPALFGNGMVLQQKQTVNIWGTANAGENVEVQLLQQKAKTVAGPNGSWKATFKPLKATSTPFEITIKGENTIVLKDVLVGEVWLCSGQSNMDMTVAKEDRYWCGVYNEAEEVASADYPSIRVFDVDFTPSMKLESDVKAKWEVCSPQTVGHFSAAAYFFARDIHKRYNVPVGLITTAFGASTAEAWISEKALAAKPDLAFLLDNYQKKLVSFYADSAVTMGRYREQLSKWKGDMAAAVAASGDVSAQGTKGKAPRAPRNPDPRIDQHNPYVLYNGMVAPLVPFAIKGALWYQGESNGATAAQYSEIMATLIADWRAVWQQGNFPFVYVQLANHQKLVTEPVKDDQMVSVRQAQLQNLSIPNTAMVVAIDNADASDYGNIHPKNKQAIGQRLAIAARGLAYNEKITWMGPIYKGMKVRNDKMVLSFKCVGQGLQAKGDTLKGFAIAGPDKKWVHASATINGKNVVVSSPEVPAPVAVRYGWAKNPACNLYNAEGLPASPFRTDK